MRITLRQLAVFSAVTRYGTTTQAAEQLALTQSAASMALAELESQLAVQLFDRIGKRLLINECGRLLYPKALTLLEQAAEIEGLFDAEQFSLRIGASSTIGNYLVPGLIADLREDYPASRFELKVANVRDIVDAVARLEVDVGLIEGPCHHADLSVIPWLPDELVIFAAVSHSLAQQPASLALLAQAEWVLREQGSGTREMVEQLLLPHLGPLKLSMEFGNSEAIKRAVARGIGISCLSRLVLADYFDSGLLVPLATPLPLMTRQLYLVSHRQKHQSFGLQRFIAHCLSLRS